MVSRPFALRGGSAGNDAIRGRRRRDRRGLEMESVVAQCGLVLLRGEGQRRRGFRTWLPGRKRRGRAMCPRQGVAFRGS